MPEGTVSSTIKFVLTFEENLKQLLKGMDELYTQTGMAEEIAKRAGKALNAMFETGIAGEQTTNILRGMNELLLITSQLQQGLLSALRESGDPKLIRSFSKALSEVINKMKIMHAWSKQDYMLDFKGVEGIDALLRVAETPKDLEKWINNLAKLPKALDFGEKVDKDFKELIKSTEALKHNFTGLIPLVFSIGGEFSAIGDKISGAVKSFEGLNERLKEVGKEINELGDDAVEGNAKFDALVKSQENIAMSKTVILQQFIFQAGKAVMEYLDKLETEFNKLTYQAAGGAAALSAMTRNISGATGLSTQHVQESVTALAKSGLRAEESFAQLTKATATFSYATGIAADSVAKFVTRLEKFYGDAKMSEQVLGTMAYAMKEFGLNAEEGSEILSNLNKSMISFSVLQESATVAGKVNTEQLEKNKQQIQDLSINYIAVSAAVKKFGGDLSVVAKMIEDLSSPMKALNSELMVFYAVSGSLADILAGDMAGAMGSQLEFLEKFEKQTEGMNRVAKDYVATALFGSTAQLKATQALREEVMKYGDANDSMAEKYKLYAAEMEKQANLQKDFESTMNSLSSLLKQAFLPLMQALVPILEPILTIFKGLAWAVSQVTIGWKKLTDAIFGWIPKSEEGRFVIGLLTAAFTLLVAALVMTTIKIIVLKKAAGFGGIFLSSIKTLTLAFWGVTKAAGAFLLNLLRINVAKKASAASDAVSSVASIPKAATAPLGGIAKGTRAFGGFQMAASIAAMALLAAAIALLFFAIKGATGADIGNFAIVMGILIASIILIGLISKIAMPAALIFVKMMLIVAVGVLALAFALHLLMSAFEPEQSKMFLEMAVGLLALAGAFFVFVLALAFLAAMLVVIIFGGIALSIMSGAVKKLADASKGLVDVKWDDLSNFLERSASLDFANLEGDGYKNLIWVIFAMSMLATSMGALKDVDAGSIDAFGNAIQNIFGALGLINKDTIEMLKDMGMGFWGISPFRFLIVFIKDFIDLGKNVSIAAIDNISKVALSLHVLASSLTEFFTVSYSEGIISSLEKTINSIIDQESNIEKATEIINKLVSAKDNLGKEIKSGTGSLVSFKVDNLEESLKPLIAINDVAGEIKNSMDKISGYNENIDKNVEEIKNNMGTSKPDSLIKIRKHRWL